MAAGDTALPCAVQLLDHFGNHTLRYSDQPSAPSRVTEDLPEAEDGNVVVSLSRPRSQGR